ncbi:MAG: MerR family transcriptional regulator [Paracoccaceae bacterium]
MEKSPEAFRTISEVAEALETPAHVLRFWESRFPQIRPVKRAGGRRYYRPSDVALLAGIKRLLHDDGLTIRGVQKILREQGVRHVAALMDPAGGALLLDSPPPAEPAAPAAPLPAGEVVAFQAAPRAAVPVPAPADLLDALEALRPPLPGALAQAMAVQAKGLAAHLGRLRALMHEDP